MEYDDIQRIAMGFVLENETWPVFLEWCRKNPNSERLRKWLESQPDIRELRAEYLLR